jgi:DNA-binding response OmpR family regulator
MRRERIEIGACFTGRETTSKALMATTFESRRKVMFVDDDRDFLELIQSAAALSQTQWDILIADSTAKALAILKEQPIHLAIIDVNMPVLDGSQFLTLLNRQHPSMMKVMLTGVPNEATRMESLGNGAELFLEKPRDQSEQEILFAMLNEVMARRSEEGFQGVLQQVGLVDVIQMACLGGSSAVLEIKSPRKNGEVFIRNGAIIHAQAGLDIGQEALNRLLRLRRGEFRTRAFVEPGEETISAPWEFLLMEGAQFRDETMHLGEGDTLLMKRSHGHAPDAGSTKLLTKGGATAPRHSVSNTCATPGSQEHKYPDKNGPE